MVDVIEQNGIDSHLAVLNVVERLYDKCRDTSLFEVFRPYTPYFHSFKNGMRMAYSEGQKPFPMSTVKKIEKNLQRIAELQKELEQSKTDERIALLQASINTLLKENNSFPTVVDARYGLNVNVSKCSSWRVATDLLVTTYGTNIKDLMDSDRVTCLLTVFPPPARRDGKFNDLDEMHSRRYALFRIVPATLDTGEPDFSDVGKMRYSCYVQERINKNEAISKGKVTHMPGEPVPTIEPVLSMIQWYDALATKEKGDYRNYIVETAQCMITAESLNMFNAIINS